MAMYDLSYNPQDPLFDIPNFPGVRWESRCLPYRTVMGLTRKSPIRGDRPAACLSCTGLSWAGQQRRSDGRVDVRLEWQDSVLTWHIEAWHAEALKSIKLQLWGLPAEVLNLGWWNPTTKANEVFHPQPNQPIQWTYPLGWVTPLACVGGNGNAFCFSVRTKWYARSDCLSYQVALSICYGRGLVCDQMRCSTVAFHCARDSNQAVPQSSEIDQTSSLI